MRKTVVIDVAGLTPGLVGPATPALDAWTRRGVVAAIHPTLPALDAVAHATYLTGVPPSQHGIVGNGWYSRSDCEIRFDRTAGRLVQAPPLWETARHVDPRFTCANLYWCFNRYAGADITLGPLVARAANGRRFPDAHAHPPFLRDWLRSELGAYPGSRPGSLPASLRESRWIAEAARRVDARFDPTLTLLRLPHLAHGVQRLGPSDAALDAELRALDAIAGALIADYEARGAQVILLSAYGASDVSRPVHLNRLLREHGLLAVRDERGADVMDPGASAAFAVADHQIAHVYVNDRARAREVRALLHHIEGVAAVLDEAGKREQQLDHARAGDFIVVAHPDAWFSYHYWTDPERAPDFARTVDPERKPGYEPLELFSEVARGLPSLRLRAKRLAQGLGLWVPMDTVPLDAARVRGSYGRRSDMRANRPLFATQRADLLDAPEIDATDVHRLILRHCMQSDAAADARGGRRLANG